MQEVLILLTGLHELNDITDTVTKNALGRFETAFAKAYSAQVEAGLDGLDLDSTPAFGGIKAFFDAIRVDVEEVIQRTPIHRSGLLPRRVASRLPGLCLRLGRRKRLRAGGAESVGMEVGMKRRRSRTRTRRTKKRRTRTTSDVLVASAA